MSKRESQYSASEPKRMMQTPRNTPYMGEQTSAFVIEKDIKDLMGSASLQEKQMTASDVWKKMSSRNAILTTKEKNLLVEEFNNTQAIEDPELPDANPKLSQRSKDRMLDDANQYTNGIFGELKERLPEIVNEESSDGNTAATKLSGAGERRSSGHDGIS